MIPGVGFHPAARSELFESADYYDIQSAGLGAEFLDEIERSIKRAIDHPDAAPIVFGRTRKLFVSRFPYSVMYSVDDVGVFITAIAHHRQRPLYWRGRL